MKVLYSWSSKITVLILVTVLTAVHASCAEPAAQPESFQYIKIEIIPTFKRQVIVEYRFVGTDWGDRKDKLMQLKVYAGRGGYESKEIAEERLEVIERAKAEEMIQCLVGIDLYKLFNSYTASGSNDGTLYKITIKRHSSICEFSFQQVSEIKTDTSEAFIKFLDDMLEVFDLDVEQIVRPGG
jgi:hypothetical protein